MLADWLKNSNKWTLLEEWNLSCKQLRFESDICEIRNACSEPLDSFFSLEHFEERGGSENDAVFRVICEYVRNMPLHQKLRSLQKLGKPLPVKYQRATPSVQRIEWGNL
jgi:hypothetical protein